MANEGLVASSEEEVKRKNVIDTLKLLLPSKIQVGLLSATMPPEALEIMRKFMNKPVRILVKHDELYLEWYKTVLCQC